MISQPYQNYDDDAVDNDIDDHEEGHDETIQWDDYIEGSNPGGGINHITAVCVGTPETIMCIKI